MFKKALVGALVLLLLCAVVLSFWGRSVLSQETVRTAIAARLSQALGQPVSIGGIGAAVYPRVRVNLDNVNIGQQGSIQIRSLSIGTDLRGLLSRRIEHGSMRLTGARIQLPLPAFATTAPAGEAPPATGSNGAPAVEIVSIDEILLNGVEIVSGGRTLRGDIEIVAQDKGLLVKRASLVAAEATINISGTIADLSGPAGDLTVKAGALDLSRLLAFTSDFSGGAGLDGTSTAAPASPPSAMNMAITLDVDRATLGGMSFEKLTGRAAITSRGMTIDPIVFGIFGGRYEGSLALTLGAVPDFRLKAKLSGVDMASASAFAGSPNMMTGRLSGDLDVTGRGLDAASVASSVHGALRFDVTDGVVKNLGLIQALVLATSMRTGAFSQGIGSRDEPFTRLGGTLTMDKGEGTTQDLLFEAKDLSLDASGAVRLDGSALDLKGRVQLSEALSKQAGTDLVRYTQEAGRVTLPVTVDGSAQNPRVRIDAADLAKRAVRNQAVEEAQKALGKGLSRLFKR